MASEAARVVADKKKTTALLEARQKVGARALGN